MIREIKWYSLIGVFNTLLHSIVFMLLIAFGVTSAWANGIAFLVAATFSFFANAKLTFRQTPNWFRYILFIIIMGLLAIATGWLTDFFRLPEILAVVFFAFISWIIGFISAKKIVFRH